LSEIGLLGMIAVRRSGTRLEWDNAAMKFTNDAEANRTADAGVSRRMESIIVTLPWSQTTQPRQCCYHNVSSRRLDKAGLQLDFMTIIGIPAAERWDVAWLAAMPGVPDAVSTTHVSCVGLV
jgi:hypothetical protein